MLSMVAEFESDLIRMRTRESMAIARVEGRLRGRQPKFSALQCRHLMSLYEKGEHSQAELADLFGVARSTVYRTIQRDSAKHTSGGVS